MSAAFTHTGALASLPSGSSEGLRYLKEFLPVIDTLDPTQVTKLSDFVLPSAQILINGTSVGTIDKVAVMFSKRAEMVSRFEHLVALSWDIPGPNADSRTVMYESTSVTIFKGDATEMKCPEFNVIDLARQADGGWKAVELRTFMDPSAIVNRRREVEGETLLPSAA